MNDTGNTYCAIARIRLRNGNVRYVGTHRHVFNGETWRCTHKHRTISDAMKCAEETQA